MARDGSISQPTKLTFAQRARIYDKTAETVQKKYFDPNFNGVDWAQIARERRETILAIEEPGAFEMAIHDLVRCLKTSHTGFFHQSVRRVPGRLAIGATFGKRENDGQQRWVAQDVHEGGPADGAGLHPGDVLVKINDKAIAPPEQPMFSMGADAALTIDRDGKESILAVSVPAPRSRSNHTQNRNL